VRIGAGATELAETGPPFCVRIGAGATELAETGPPLNSMLK